MPEPRDTEWRCPSFGTGVDCRPNQCALTAGHAGAHRNRSGRVKWTDDGRHSTRLMQSAGQSSHRDFAPSPTTNQEANHG